MARFLSQFIKIFRPLAAMIVAAALGLGASAITGPIFTPAPRPAAPVAAEGMRILAHARAERDIVILPPGAPTYWNGDRGGAGDRAVAPDWVLDAVSPLRRSARARAAVRPRPWRAFTLAALFRTRRATAPETIETASIAPPREADPTRLDPTVAAAFAPETELRSTPMTSPPSTAPRPTRRPAVGDVVVRTARQPEIVIILTAVGVNEEASRRALRDLPPEIAFAVAPIAQDPAEWAGAADAQGRVVLLEIPMDPASRRARDPGPLTLRVGDAAAANLARLDAALALAPGVDGVATYLGGRFVADDAALRPILAELAARGLFLLETTPSPLSRVREMGAELGLRTVASVVSLDKAGRVRDISDSLALLEEEARRSGRAIGVAVAIPSTIRALDAWSDTARARGVRLTPLRL